MVDKRGLNSVVGTITDAGVAFGTAIPANMRRYIYKIKTANQFAGPNQLQFGYKPTGAAVILDYIEHANQYDMWNDPDEVKEDSAPIYILPAASQPYGIGSAAGGTIYVYILYEDSE